MSAPGVALAVTAGGAYAVYTLAAKRLLAAGHAPESVMAVAFGLGALVLLPALLATAADAGCCTPTASRSPCSSASCRPRSRTCCSRSGLRRLTAAETATLTLAEPLTAARARRASCSPSR